MNVINRVIRTAAPVGVESPSPLYGYGLIDARAAVFDDVALVEANPMGDLSEWIRLNRRAEAIPEPSEPVPSPSASAEPAPAPPTAGPPNPLGVVLPTVQSLRDVGIPLLVVGGFGSLLVFSLVLAGRQLKRLRRQS